MTKELIYLLALRLEESLVDHDYSKSDPGYEKTVKDLIEKGKAYGNATVELHKSIGN